MSGIIPREALAFLKNKRLQPGFSYKDVWHEEHATAFTVAKAMQLDVLSDLHTAVTNAMEQGQSFESFKKNIKPVLQDKGWWGRKDMTDPLTGKTVNAQLGSDHRLKTIYRVNMRSAYQKGHYDRTMASDLHPYLLYRLGNSRVHREEHIAWEGTLLPKTDPWWDSHFPPNDWGCNCYTVAVTEARKRRYEAEGIPTAPRLDGTGGGKIAAQTTAPPNDYRTYYNERKQTIEQVPAGVHPAFNWNQGAMGRNVSLLEHLVAKTQEKVPQQFDLIISSIFTNKVSKTAFRSFIDDALARGISRQLIAPVGFLDNRITRFLDQRNVRLGNHNIIILESRLVNSKKYRARHTLQGNAPAVGDWHKLIDWMMDAPVYWDGKGLIYLASIGRNRYMKIAVDINLAGQNHRGMRFLLPKVDTMYVLDLTGETDRGRNEHNRIINMQRVR